VKGAPPPPRPQSVSHVFVLGQQGASLGVQGDVGDLAPNEQIYSARFVGDRGYVVTFRQVDPLFVIDLAVPTAPRVAAELKIPGFSEYMHPIDDGHLLTIGQDATLDGQVTGLALQIFDVTDATQPALVHKHVYSNQESGYSEALYNHKAFTYDERLGMLAFPFTGWNTFDGSMRSSLELFRVSLTDGFASLGSVDHSAFFAGGNEYGYCGGYYGVDVRRGLFIEDHVYSISYGGVIASSINSPSVAVASVPLAAPVSPYPCYDQ